MNSNIFAIDGDWSEIFECYTVAFAAEGFSEAWNGWATPVVSRRVMEAFVAHQQFLAAAYPADYAEADTFAWDGNGVMVTAPQGEGEAGYVTWVMPNADGNFDLSTLGYTFVRLNEDDRILSKVA